MSQEVLERKANPGETQPYPNYRVILLNDERSTFEHVESCLKRHIPGMSSDRAHQLALQAQKDGAATVWVGPKELAEMYHELLKSEGLTTVIEPQG